MKGDGFDAEDFDDASDRDFAAMIVLAASAGTRAQNLPPPGSYQPIPNFTGVGAGLQFRQAINQRFGGSQPIAPSNRHSHFRKSAGRAGRDALVLQGLQECNALRERRCGRLGLGHSRAMGVRGSGA